MRSPRDQQPRDDADRTGDRSAEGVDRPASPAAFDAAPELFPTDDEC